MTQEVVVAERPLAIERAPAVVIEEARRAAALLQEIIAAKPDKVVMNGQQYLEYEDWQTVARFYGATVGEVGEPEYVNLDGVRGFKASAVVINGEGRELSRATAFCLSDEEKWGSRNKYVWGYITIGGDWSAEDPGRDQITWIPRKDGKSGNVPLKERRQTGVESVPLFQLSSMAQTRACAKALRNVFSWVVVLAGYRATPAEELDGMAQRESNGADGEVARADAESHAATNGRREPRPVNGAPSPARQSTQTSAGQPPQQAASRPTGKPMPKAQREAMQGALETLAARLGIAVPDTSGFDNDRFTAVINEFSRHARAGTKPGESAEEAIPKAPSADPSSSVTDDRGPGESGVVDQWDELWTEWTDLLGQAMKDGVLLAPLTIEGHRYAIAEITPPVPESVLRAAMEQVGAALTALA